MKYFRLFAVASDQLHEGPEVARTPPRDASGDADTAARWVRQLDDTAKRQIRDDLARARAQLVQARAELTELRRDHDAARVEATAWRRRHAEAVQDCADITARREALIESMASGMAAMMLAMSSKTWDEGWESAANDALVKLQNPYRLAAADAARPAARWS